MTYLTYYGLLGLVYGFTVHLNFRDSQTGNVFFL